MNIQEGILHDRALRYLRAYKPTVIGIVGSSALPVTTLAVQLGHAGTHLMRAGKSPAGSKGEISKAILGLPMHRRVPWWRLLIGSKIQEVVEQEPDTIAVSLKVPYPGFIDAAAQDIPWDIAIIMNAHTSHTRVFTGRDMVAHEIASLPVALKKEGIAILNIDDSAVSAMQEKIKAKIVTIGQSPDADVALIRAQRIAHAGGFIIEVKIKNSHYELALPNIIARHYISHVLAALALCHVRGIDIKKAIHHIKKIAPPAGYMNKRQGVRGATIIDDSSNATPEDMHDAIKTLAAFPGKRKIAMLGEIDDLGGQTISVHREIGKSAASHSHVLVCVGESMRHAQEAALQAGIDTHFFQHAKEVGDWFQEYTTPEDTILIKGGKHMHMEQIVKRLQKNTTRA